VKDISLLKEEAEQKGEEFNALREEELLKKVKGENSNSPFFYSIRLLNARGPHENLSAYLLVANPDPVVYCYLYVSLFFAAANMLDDNAFCQELAAASRDTDSPWRHQTGYGFDLPAGGRMRIPFSFSKPAGVFRTDHFPNCVLWQREAFRQGTYFDRTCFEVSWA
jgi:hypothetical protein